METGNRNRKGRRKMIGWLIALIVVVVLFAVGAVFCAPWSPVHKKIAQAQKPSPTTELVQGNHGAKGEPRL